MADATTDRITPTHLHLHKSSDSPGQPGGLEITWADGRQARLPLRYLRQHCPCAGCQGERDLLGRQLLPIVKTAHDGPIAATGAELVGNYAPRIDWSDGHNTGIYSFRYLRELDERYAKENAAPSSGAAP